MSSQEIISKLLNLKINAEIQKKVNVIVSLPKKNIIRQIIPNNSK